MNKLHYNPMLQYLIMCLMISLGCGKNDGRVAVTGTLLVDGKPAEGVSIAFIDASGTTMATALTGAGGEFSVRAGGGKNNVALSKEEQRSGPPPNDDPESQTMGTDEQVREAMKNAPKALLPAKLADPETSGLSFDLKDGASIEISVSSK